MTLVATTPPNSEYSNMYGTCTIHCTSLAKEENCSYFLQIVKYWYNEVLNPRRGFMTRALV